MAKAINQTQYAKVIDKGVNAPMTGLFLPGSPYYTKTAYPKYDPTGAAKLVKQVAAADGQAGRRSPSTRPATPRRWRRRSSCSRTGSRRA